MAELTALHTLTAQMKREGIRRLLVLSGEERWCFDHALKLRDALPGDWLWISPQPDAENHCSPSALQTLLGREFRHAVFDARQGFDAAAFAALSGTLKAGSWLVLLLPVWDEWENQPDADSLRWSDCPDPIATPHFVQHFKRVLTANNDAILWRQNQPFSLAHFTPRTDWHPATGAPQPEQQQLLQQLLTMPPGVAAVTAARGRGKSALAGQLISRIAGSAIVTAPAKAATDVLAQFAGEKFRFIAPDALLASDEQADWLVVDEAAAIPAPLLHQLVSRFPRTLLTTTVQGYEGTGRGFLLKFCARFPHLHRFELQQPIRWAQGCPLEKMVSEALVFDDENFTHTPQGNIVISAFEQTLWRSEPETPLKVYQLLSGAHYRTSPLDLRRMMDAPGQHFLQAAGENEIAGALCLVDEGGLSQELSQAVWAGYRRPRGNLVAQSLAAHGSNPLAATLRGRRVSRIAVHPARQREGTGRQLIAGALQYIHDLDYLSVSFGYTEELWRFWQRCGFVLVRMGNHREASSGCYTAMALLPMSDAGKQLAEREHYRLRRDAQALAQWNGEMLPVDPLNDAVLSDDDWLELAGFAFTHRPLLTSLGCLLRLLQTSELALPALRGRLQKNASDAQLCTTLKLSGRKLLLVRQREEAAQALFALDDVCTERLRDRITQWQFFH
ncbi:tRNA cytosine(34) acetyltransferase TmcA [Escherichia coli]|uniref:tRNA(Met) cytidine acetyltransferase TmcA n=2 Tax=Escherichia coli TaxID=562 RepID=A0A3R1BMN7_ECOLX|nr:tRNA cytosine(34) acetyltransferase TmcA [Escherichia coli]EEZ9621067.1 tRNA(Met) cytidine acetyltransferase [Escherichia coli O32]EFW8104873.1 tRNA(Met) cytidine acetyltransferase [Shigella sonnei]EIG6218824.1 tRNA cytosine(34) acetyltransferase TmcA [Shigella dysenteriae]EIH4990841.1 tRNA cytosine(34) acetyltransferase TmcA [Shigella boydii]HDL6812546.1 tRNA cytosine(34) acetyltransferase TmcA [Escherichia coli 371_08]HDL6817720.1 tRNA cytosine(34) acetyltransferase TmcA [Escherichia col